MVYVCGGQNAREKKKEKKEKKKETYGWKKGKELEIKI